MATDPAIAMQFLDKALRLAGDDELARMAALNNRAHLLGQIGNVDGAVRLIEEAIEIAASTGHRHREAALHNHLADLHHVAGRVSEADRAMTDAVALFADIDAGEWEPELWFLSKWRSRNGAVTQSLAVLATSNDGYSTQSYFPPSHIRHRPDRFVSELRG